jgi:hypothetical protein
MKLTLIIPLIIVLSSCNNEKPEENLAFSKFQSNNVNYYMDMPNYRVKDFEPSKMVIRKIHNSDNTDKNKKDLILNEIINKEILTNYFNLISKKYSKKYCCEPDLNKDFSMVFSDGNNKMKFYIDTLTKENDMIIFPTDFNYCLKIKNKINALTNFKN